MKIFSETDIHYDEILAQMNRRFLPSGEVRDIVADIIDDVSRRGDEALADYARRFDHVVLEPSALRITPEEMQAACAAVSEEVKEAVEASLHNIHYFARNSLRTDWSGVNAQGCKVGERFVPYDRIGIYIPGGKAPLVSTALMTGGFAQAAGVSQIVAVTPCGADGKVNANVLYALQEAGAAEIYRIGGAQAVAALALGTASIAPVRKIFGPGNRFVVEAKRQLMGTVAIDLLPGPSEVMVLADATANPVFVAADLLAQAEHGPDSVIALVTTSETLMESVQNEIKIQSATLSRGSIVKAVLDEHAVGVLVPDLKAGARLANSFAPEHLVLIVDQAAEEEILDSIATAGAIYVGNYSTVACGDFLAGPSHTLPTGGSGKSFSGIRADQFQRRTSIVRMDKAAAERSLPYVSAFARVEGLDAHGRSLALRVNDQ